MQTACLFFFASKFPSVPATRDPRPKTMKFAVLFPVFLLPAVSLAHTPTPLRAVDGRDLSFLLKRYDGPIPILRRAAKGKRHTVPRTLQVEEVLVHRSFSGLVERQQCADAGYVPCPDGSQCCPAGETCGPGNCCPGGDLTCAGNCKNHSHCFTFSSLTRLFFLRLSRSPRRLLPERWVLPEWTGKNVCSNGLVYFSFVVPQSCFTAINGDIGCCPRGQTCTTISGE